KPCVRNAAFGTPVLPVVNVTSAASVRDVWHTAAVLPVAYDNPNLMGIRRMPFEKRRNRWAFQLPTKALQSAIRQQVSNRSILLHWSTKTMVAPTWKSASTLR